MKDKIAVICRYAENLDWLKDIKIPYVVYNKGELDISCESVTVPNKGRESEVFLRYIKENYFNLPSYIVFLQGDPHYHCPNVIELINSHSDEYFKSLSTRFVVDDETGAPNHPGLPIKEIAQLLNLNTISQFYQFGPGAQYIVSKELILNKTFDWWCNAYEIHENFKLSPWVYERLWPIIFKYTNK